LSGGVSSRARDLCEVLKQQLVDLEGPLRRGSQAEPLAILVQAVDRFIERGARFFAGLSHEESLAAGRVLARELHPYLVRARLAELAIASGLDGVSDPRVQAHVLVGRAEGSDPLGVALDRVLLDLDTAAGLRHVGDLVAKMLPLVLQSQRSARVLVVPCGAGTVAASVGQRLALTGGELTCVDGDRGALGFVDAGVAARPANVRLRLLHEDLAILAMGASNVFHEGQDLVVLDGYTEYLPDRLVGSLGSVVLRMLRPGGSVLVATLGPSRDAFVFDHLLGWRTIRRSAASLSLLLTEVGLEEITVVETSGAGRLIHLRRPQTEP
jgi:SAM-dependent methyltransferase